VKDKIREVGLASLGLGITIKEKVKHIGRKLVKKGEANEKRILSHPKERFAAGAHLAGKEALVISRKSLAMLERELKKLEKEAKKGARVAKKAVKKRVAKRLAKTSKKKRR
jgi:polyhydroxyalkanoate synthesis regulator phasin